MDNRRTAVPTSDGAQDLEHERERALDVITTAFSHGSMDLEEYEKRATAIQKAKAPADIDAQTLDLPLPRLPQDQPSSGRGVRGTPGTRGTTGSASAGAPFAAPRRDDYMIEKRDGTPEFSLCVMGDRKLAGDWLNSDQAVSVTLMGCTTLDLRNTALPPGRLKIDAVAIMGEIKILVPHGLPVKMSAFPLMGEANIHRSVEQRISRGEPWVDVSGIALMGSIVVKAVD